MARTLSTPDTCWVTPIDHTSTAEPADAYMRAKRAMSARVAPDDCSSTSYGSSSSSASTASKPAVRAFTNPRSIPPIARSSFITPLTNATSPPVWIGKNSSAIFVPNTALSAFDGTQ